MQSVLPEEYTGWEAEAARLRRAPAAEVQATVASGSAPQRLAALAVVDLAAVPRDQVERWLRELAPAEANVVVAGIANLARTGCRGARQALDLARRGYEARGLPTLLVTIFDSLVELDRLGCHEAPVLHEAVADWVATQFERLAANENLEALDDFCLFVFESGLDDAALFESFCTLAGRHAVLALKVSANPSLFLGGLPEAKQRAALEECERGGGLPLRESWARLVG